MADNTKIEWADATVNYVNGCTMISAGCTNCYAMRLAGTRMKDHPTRAGLTMETKAGPVWTGEVRTNEKQLMEPLAWKRPRRIFWNAHGDLFHSNVPDAWIDRQFAVMALTPQHTHMVLTKRPERMRDYVSGTWHTRIIPQLQELQERPAGHGILLRTVNGVLPNVWLGTSVEDQRAADERIPHLLATPATVRFLSCEPLLSPLDLQEWLICPNARDGLSMDPSTGAYECCRSCDYTGLIGGIDWVIAGGESGPGARPMHPDWARSLRDQCAAAGVAFHFKQWGEWAPSNAFGMASDRPVSDRRGNVRDWMNRYVVSGAGTAKQRGEKLRAHTFTGHATNLVYRIGKARAGRLLDGRTHDDYPGSVANG